MDVRFGPERQLQPDLLVTRGTRGRDPVTKRRVYEQAGVASYWLVDPAVPSLTALQLRDSAYVEVARVEGGKSWTAERPYPLTVDPTELVR